MYKALIQKKFPQIFLNIKKSINLKSPEEIKIKFKNEMVLLATWVKYQTGNHKQREAINLTYKS